MQYIRTRVEQGDNDGQIKHQLEQIAHQVIDIETIERVDHFTRAGEQGQYGSADEGQLRQNKGQRTARILDEQIEQENQTAHQQDQHFRAGRYEI